MVPKVEAVKIVDPADRVILPLVAQATPTPMDLLRFVPFPKVEPEIKVELVCKVIFAVVAP